MITAPISTKYLDNVCIGEGLVLAERCDIEKFGHILAMEIIHKILLLKAKGSCVAFDFLRDNATAKSIGDYLKKIEEELGQ